MAYSNPSTWSAKLTWIECAHKSMSSAATGHSSVKASLGYQPLLFPALEAEIAVPSVQLHLRHCRWIWKETRAALFCSVDQNKRLADRRCTPAPLSLQVRKFGSLLIIFYWKQTLTNCYLVSWVLLRYIQSLTPPLARSTYLVQWEFTQCPTSPSWNRFILVHCALPSPLHPPGFWMMVKSSRSVNQ